jgi:hypothetical protein
MRRNVALPVAPGALLYVKVASQFRGHNTNGTVLSVIWVKIGTRYQDCHDASRLRHCATPVSDMVGDSPATCISLLYLDLGHILRIPMHAFPSVSPSDR